MAEELARLIRRLSLVTSRFTSPTTGLDADQTTASMVLGLGCVVAHSVEVTGLVGVLAVTPTSRSLRNNALPNNALRNNAS